MAEKHLDSLVVLDRESNETHALRNLLNGGCAFLVCGGPSANSENLDRLNMRGIFSLAVNNMAGHSDHRPSAFVCSDPPSKFHDGIWLDPHIMKFIPTPKMRRGRGRLRRKVDGKFEPLVIRGEAVSTLDCPNLWGFSRRSWLSPDDTFFTEDSAAWGNHNAGTLQTGQPKTVCTLLLGLRILYYLGARTIFLVGVDFRMDPTRSLLGNYAFGEARDDDAVTSNNAQYQIVDSWLTQMAASGVFQRFGVSVYNCYEFSGLRAFPFVPFADAVGHSLRHFPSLPFDLVDWYAK